LSAAAKGGAELAVFRRFGGPPREDLAFEEELLAMAAAGRPALFAYTWPRPTAVLGYGQPVEDIDLEACRRLQIEVLRRITGGAGVVHSGDLAVSLALPASHPWAGRIAGLYDRFLGALGGALGDAGAEVRRPDPPSAKSRRRSPICFEDQAADTLTIGGRKAVGCAQARRKAAVLVHAAILLGLDADLYAAVFGVDAERIRRALAPAVTGVTPDDLAGRIARRLGEALDLAPRPPEAPPVADRFLDRYRDPHWAPLTA